jgi:type II secretion system protein G
MAGGFTLIELLVVISIIGMLSSLVLGAVSNARKKAFYAKAAIDIRTVETALEMYYMDHGDWPDVGQARTGPNEVEPDIGYVSWPLLEAKLRPYLPKIPTPSYSSKFGFREYVYLNGSVTPTQNQLSDSATQQFLGCVRVGKGYWLDFFWDDIQTPLTLNDGGFDPDGIDSRRGDVRLLPPQPDQQSPDYCPAP